MGIERTLSIIKPDGLQSGVIGKIITRFEDKGLKPVAIRLQQLSQKEAEGFYAVHKDRGFFKDLVNFMVSGPVCVMVLAATRDEAERFAERDEDSCVSDSLRDAGSASAHEPKVLDTDLADTLPWHDEDVPDRTCAEWLALIRETDAQAKRESEFAARQVPLPIG